MPTIFKLKFSSISKHELFQFIEDRISDRAPSYIVTPNLHFARVSYSNPSFLTVLEEADIRLCDSAILSALLRIKRDPVVQRLPGSDITVELMKLACRKKWRIFLFGSDNGTLERVRRMFPEIICDLTCPPVHPRIWELEQNEAYVEQIKLAKPDILFVGLGAQKQEYWANKFYKSTEVPITLCIGASLDFIGGRIKRAPRWISRIGFEWLWRLCMEPRRLLTRYALDAVFLAIHLPWELIIRTKTLSEDAKQREF